MSSKPKTKKLLRREKRSPNENLWHTLLIGVPIGFGLLLFLPFFIH